MDNLADAGESPQGWRINFARLKEVFLAFLPLGFITFGGPQAHIAVLQQEFVDKRQWLDDKQFTELFGLASALPGPASSQMVAAIGYIRAGYIGGILALTIFQLPGFIVMAAAGLASTNDVIASFLDNPPAWFVGLKQGLFASAIALIAISVYKLGLKAADTKFTQAIMTVTTILTLLIRAPWSLPLYLFGSGLLSFVLIKLWPEKFDKTPPKPQSTSHEKVDESIGESEPLADTELVELDNEEQMLDSQPQRLRTSKSCLQENDSKWGITFIVTTVVFLILLIVLRNVTDSNLVRVAETFYRCGALIYGGGQVVLPMLITELVDTGMVSESLFLYGLALIQVLPGPLFNFSAYLGACIAGVPGMLLSWCCIFAPGTMLIFGLYPFWARLSKQSWMQKVLVGVNSGALGLIVAGFFILWVKVELKYIASACLGFALTFFYNISTPLVIFVSGLLGLGINLIFPD